MVIKTHIYIIVGQGHGRIIDAFSLGCKTDYTCKPRENKVGYIVLLMEIKLKARYVIQ